MINYNIYFCMKYIAYSSLFIINFKIPLEYVKKDQQQSVRKNQLPGYVCVFTFSPVLAKGALNHCSNVWTLLNMWGRRKLRRDQSSGSLFCSGVPEKWV